MPPKRGTCVSRAYLRFECRLLCFDQRLKIHTMSKMYLRWVLPWWFLDLVDLYCSIMHDQWPIQNHIWTIDLIDPIRTGDIWRAQVPSGESLQLRISLRWLQTLHLVRLRYTYFRCPKKDTQEEYVNFVHTCSAGKQFWGDPSNINISYIYIQYIYK